VSDITVFKAHKIITMDPNCPTATHVAVRDGKILAVGGPTCADQWGASTLDEQLADAVLMPGFVEGHAHMTEGSVWNYAYMGYHDRLDPQGKFWAGKTDLEQVIQALLNVEKDLAPGAPLICWGFDPIFMPTERLNRHHLDQVSNARPVIIFFSNLHVMCVNTPALELVEFTADTDVEGVVKGADGTPTGELQEFAAMFPIMRRTGFDILASSREEPTVRAYARVCNRSGVTTVTDLFSTMPDADLELLLRLTSEPGFPVRIVPALGAMEGSAESFANNAIRLRQHSTDKLRLGSVKIMSDGSIQGFTARVKWPGYLQGKANGIWNIPPNQINAIIEAMQQAGVQIHIHVNGDEASSVALDAFEAAARKYPWPGARHVMQHCQMMETDQFKRCAQLDICTNFFSNHIWFFGKQHAQLILGNDRAQRLNGARSALDAGVNIAIHCDAPVTPMGPLFTAWCAVNRQTMDGKTLGAAQCITVDEALHAITLGAAYTLKLDQEIGSIETGKIADFAVLAQDPTAVAPMALKDVAVLGTVSGGELHLL